MIFGERLMNEQTENRHFCDCEKWARSACSGKDVFEHDGRPYCVLHYPSEAKIEAFRLAVRKKLEVQDFNFLGVWFPEIVDFQRFQFTADVHFRGAFFHGEANFIGAKFIKSAYFNESIFRADANFAFVTFSESANFGGVTFCETVGFYQANFNGDASFNESKFSGETTFDYASFSAKAYFNSAKYKKKANLALAKFMRGTYFRQAAFSKDVNFSDSVFSEEVDFYAATFNAEAKFNKVVFAANVNFNEATFDSAVGFYKATFKDYVYFAGSAEKRVLGEKPHLKLNFAHIEKPDRFSFDTLDLVPHWFVSVDPRKFEFVRVRWDEQSMQEEIEALSRQSIAHPHPHHLLAITYRQLAVNAEENHRYEEASRFRYSAMDVYRLERIRQDAWWRTTWQRSAFLSSKLLKPIGQFFERLSLLHQVYWFASGYSERVWRAFFVLLLVLFSFAWSYTRVGFTQLTEKTSAAAVTISVDSIGKPLNFKQALAHSFEVVLLQRPEPKPLTLMARFLVALETVLGPLQGALLALAVRRKFMR